METLEKNGKQTKGSKPTSFKKKKMEGSPKTMGFKENLQPGDILTVTINALGAKNIGVAELKNGYTVLVPNTKYGEKVQVKIEKILFAKSSDAKLQQKIKYVVARVISTDEQTGNFEKNANSFKFDFSVGQKFNVTIGKKGPKNAGLVQLSKNFLLIVPNTKVGDKVCVQIQKIKQNYAFAKAISTETEISQNALSHDMVGKQFHIVVPSSAKTVGNYFVVKFNGKCVFVKKSLGVKGNDVVNVQIQKATKNFAVAKIVEISPLSSFEKKAIIKENVEKMISASMHFGEKAIRCNANMRKFLWYRRKTDGFSIHASKLGAPFFKETRKPMVKRGRHILNVLKTQRCFDKALKQLAKYAAKGKTFLFVGTKKPAASLIAKTALLSHTSFFVNTRWLGGMLTNWKTILKSISQIRPILKQKQKILQKILEKRQKIQRRLFQKVYMLRKKSQKFMLKGKYLIQQLLVSKNVFVEKQQTLLQKKNAILSSNAILLTTAKNLKVKKAQIFKQIQQLETAAAEISKQKQHIKVLMNAKITKFHEFEQFFNIGQKFLEKKNALENTAKTKFVAISYDKFSTLNEAANWTIPNPSAEIFKKMIAVVSSLKNENFAGQLASNRAKSVEQTESSNSQGSTIVVSKFLHKFVLLLPLLENALKVLSSQVAEDEKTLRQLQETLQKIETSQKAFQDLYQKIQEQLTVVFSKFLVQKQNFKKFQIALKQLMAEQRLLKFLPKLRYLPTSQTKMYTTVELFMKKFVDPKLSYPMEQIYDQKLKFTSKKIASTRKQKWQRLEKYFGGITKMAKLNTKQISKNVAIIIGQQEEMNAVHECRKLGMKIFAVVDTNCNPKCVDHIIPANDDSRNSIKYILGEMLTYIRLGQKLRKKVSVRAKFQQTRKRRFGGATRLRPGF